MKPNFLNALTLNVRGLNDGIKRKMLFSWLHDNDIQIAFLQETFCTPKLQPYFDAGWKGKVVHCITYSSHSSVSILISEKLDCKIINTHISDDGRKVLVNLEIFENVISLVSVYAPNQEQKRVEFFKRLMKWIKQYTLNDENILVAGDLNCCLLDTDRNTTSHLKDKSRLTLSKLIDLNGIWSSHNP